MVCNGIEIKSKGISETFIFIPFSENSPSLYSFIVVDEEVLLHSELFNVKM